MKFFRGDKTVLELQSGSFVVWPQKNNAPILIQDDESAGEKTGSDTGFKPCSLAGLMGCSECLCTFVLCFIVQFAGGTVV